MFVCSTLRSRLGRNWDKFTRFYFGDFTVKAHLVLMMIVKMKTLAQDMAKVVSLFYKAFFFFLHF